eukprot:5931672-Alexandrium_andersonii.AAC.4
MRGWELEALKSFLGFTEKSNLVAPKLAPQAVSGLAEANAAASTALAACAAKTGAVGKAPVDSASEA